MQVEAGDAKQSATDEACEGGEGNKKTFDALKAIEGGKVFGYPQFVSPDRRLMAFLIPLRSL